MAAGVWFSVWLFGRWKQVLYIYSWFLTNALRDVEYILNNPASYLKPKGKGKIEVGADADILLLDKNTLKLRSVIAKGRVVMTPKWTHHGMFGISTPAPAQRMPSSAEKERNTRRWLSGYCDAPPTAVDGQLPPAGLLGPST